MKKLNLTKKFLFVFVFAIFCFANCFFSVFSLKTNAYTNYYGTNSVEVKNGKFTSYQNAGKGVPNKVSDWEVCEDVIEANTMAGIISVDNDTFRENNYSLSSNPETDKSLTNKDDYILMLKSINNQQTKYGFKSKDITLESGKFYVLRVHCKTTLGAKASIYTSLSKDFGEFFQSIDTGAEWKTFNFFIATDSFNSISDFNVELRLGSSRQSTTSGAVFFDQVEILEIANKDYYEANEDNQVKINLDNDYITSFENSDFENGLEGFIVEKDNSDGLALVNSVEAINNEVHKNFEDEEIDANNNSTNFLGENKGQLLILNKEKAKTSVKTSSLNTIKIKQHGFYRLSFLLKTGKLSSNGLDATLASTKEIVSGEGIISKSQTGLKSSSDSKAYNGFTQVDFYIRGNTFKDLEVSLNLSLGNDETQISGYAIVDNITLQKISQSEYSKGTDTNKLDLSEKVSNTQNITNGSFNFVDFNTSDISYPAKPLDWTGSENLTNSGIIRVNEAYFKQDHSNYGLTVDKNPGYNPKIQGGISLSDTFENVLMVRNQSVYDVYFKSTPSSDVTLASNGVGSSTITRIDVAVKTLSNSKAFIKVVSGDKILGIIDNISAEDWTTYSLYIKNGISAKTINLLLGIHGNNNYDNTNNYAFFDDVKYVSDEKDFNLENILSSNTSYYFDLLNNSFCSHSNETVVENVYKQTFFESFSSDSAPHYNGIIDATGDESIKPREEAKDKKVLVLANQTLGYQILKSTESYELKAGSYYEFSIWIKNSNLVGLKETESYGINFGLYSINSNGEVSTDKENNKFENIIVSSNEENNNGWVKYSIFVLAENDQSVKVLLGLGSKDNAVIGEAYFDDLTTAEISKETYASKKQDKNTIISKVIKLEENTDSNPSETENNNIGINIWALLSSIILVIALILAIIGFAIRRIPKRQIAKIKMSEYNKSPYAIDEDKIKRELKEKREEKIKEINAKLEGLEKEKLLRTQKHEEDIQSLEASQEKNSEYVKFVKDINAINKKIDYLNSAINYITDLNNIKNEERNEINERKKKSKEEFLKLKDEDENNTPLN